MREDFADDKRLNLVRMTEETERIEFPYEVQLFLALTEDILMFN